MALSYLPKKRKNMRLTRWHTTAVFILTARVSLSPSDLDTKHASPGTVSCVIGETWIGSQPLHGQQGKESMLYSTGEHEHSVASRTSQTEHVVSQANGENMFEDKQDTASYKVVVNHEEQYSIWPAHRENALGWRDEGKVGTKEECLAHIKNVWTDMRPLSLRKKMQEQGLS